MADDTLHMKKGDEVIEVSRTQVSVFKEDGWELTGPPPKPQADPAVPAPPVLGPEDVVLVKGNDKCIAHKRQVAALCKAGWSDASGKEASDGREQHSGRPLDQASRGDAGGKQRKQPERVERSGKSDAGG